MSYSDFKTRSAVMLVEFQVSQPLHTLLNVFLPRDPSRAPQFGETLRVQMVLPYETSGTFCTWNLFLEELHQAKESEEYRTAHMWFVSPEGPVDLLAELGTFDVKSPQWYGETVKARLISVLNKTR